MSERILAEHDVLLCAERATTTPDQRHAAARATANHAHDADELARLLAMLGIDPREDRP